MATTSPEAGQAGVEAALALPLLIFLFLGTLQLFMLMQARFLAEYAVFRAARAGSLGHGNCAAMTHAAIVSVLPAIERTDSPAALEVAFKKHSNNRYDNVRLQPGTSNPAAHTGQIIELWRDIYLGPTREVMISTDSMPDPEDTGFDQPDRLMRLEVRMVFWYHLKIPFADWVLGKIFLTHYRLTSYTAVNPLQTPQRRVDWSDGTAGNFIGEPWPGGPLGDSMLAFADAGHQLFPIRVTWSMRMMTPAKKKYFEGSWGCPL